MKTHPLIGDALETLLHLLDEGRAVALVTILDGAGSIPRKPGTKAIVDSDGAIWGTIGGGLLEAEAQRKAIQSLHSQCPTLFDFRFSGSSARDNDPICGGQVRILIDPIPARHRHVYEQAIKDLQQHQRGILLTTVVHENIPQINIQWFLQRDIKNKVSGFSPEINAAIYSAIENVKPIYASANADSRDREVLIEPLFPKPRLIIAGGGHVGQALAQQASLVGFTCVVYDDRPDFIAPHLYPYDVITRSGKISDLFDEFPVTEDTYIAIVGRGHRADMETLKHCITQPAAYIGLMGSRRKIALVRKEIIDSGIANAEQFDRIYSPIGLDINAETVPEIAASIVAQLIAVRRKAKMHKLEHL